MIKQKKFLDTEGVDLEKIQNPVLKKLLKREGIIHIYSDHSKYSETYADRHKEYSDYSAHSDHRQKYTEWTEYRDYKDYQDGW